jgi:hypothetical protein
MSNLVKSSYGFQRTPSESTLASVQDTYFGAGEDLEANPFDGKKTWDEFKKEYYQLEKKVKKSLENLHVIMIEFAKHISLTGPQNSNNTSISALGQDFQSISSQVKFDLGQISELFHSLRRTKGDMDEIIKQNMLKRFREIHQDHEKEYTRLNNSFELNKKKLELFNETLKLGELNVDKKIGSSTALMMQQNQSLADAVDASNRIVNQARMVSTTFGNQQLRLNSINVKVKALIEEFGSVSEILRKIKYFKLKKTIVIYAVLVLIALFLIFRIIWRWM